MLFEKNIETFFEWQPVGVVCFFLLPPAFPRVDGGGPGGRELDDRYGAHNPRYGELSHHLAPMETSGVFSTAPGDGNGYNMSVTSPNYGPTNFTIDAGLMWGSDHVGSAFAPEHVLLPVILYLGLSYLNSYHSPRLSELGLLDSVVPQDRCKAMRCVG